VESDSPGKLVGQVLDKATPLGTAVAVGDALKAVAGKGGNSVNTKDSHDVTGSYNQDRHDVVEGREAP
jgi:hypothetical protein